MIATNLNEPLVKEAVTALLKYEKGKLQASTKNLLVDGYAKPILVHVRLTSYHSLNMFFFDFFP